MPLPLSVTRQPTPNSQSERPPTAPNTLYACLGWSLGLSCLLLGAIALVNGAPARVTAGLCLVGLATLPCSPLPDTLRWVAGGLGLALC